MPETDTIETFEWQSGTNLLQDLNFRYPLRKYQEEILDLVNTKLENGERELHIVAPPGAGKTIIGLQIISQMKCPSLILSPNTTIQSQWGQKIDLFLPPELESLRPTDLIGTHEDKPLKPITLLTYQVLSTPGREVEYLEKLAHKSWVEELSRGRSLSIGDCELRILELLQNNPKAHQQEMSRHVSRLRKRLTEVLDLKEVLHENALELLQALRRQNFKLVIFDECHHLTDYWAAVMTHLVRRLGDPVIVGLTGTPPEGKSSSQENRYLSLVGEIDYQVPTPALVKEGGLAPFQDLVFFTEPVARELEFLEEQHREFHALIVELSAPITKRDAETGIETRVDSPLTEWVKCRIQAVIKREPAGDQKLSFEGTARASHVLDGHQGGHIPKVKAGKDGSAKMRVTRADLAKQKKTGAASSKRSSDPGDPWKAFAEESPEHAAALCRYLYKAEIPFPREIEVTEAFRQSPLLEDWMLVLEDYASHKLKLSSSTEDHNLFEQIKQAARKLGYGITEQGLRKQASPVDRVLAFSASKPYAVVKILEHEYRCLQDRLRAVVVTDFEAMSATQVKALQGVLDENAGGAIATLRTLLADPLSDYFNPCLVTGSHLLTDKRITAQFVEAAAEYLKSAGYDFKLTVKDEETAPFSEISANSSDWQSKLYVGMATAIFERGITKCLVGTRGLFGEGWDSQALNTLIDLTTTTSPVSVKQLRGRSIRIQTDDALGARKVANNWDVVCVAPQLEKGLNDYQRFVRKHDGYFGICDDGQIECGVGHVHASLSELTPIEVFASSETFNQEMISRALVRDQIYDLWKVGQPYKNKMLGCVDLTRLRKLALTPPYIRKGISPKSHAREMREALSGVWIEHGVIGAAAAGALACFLASTGVFIYTAVLPVLIAIFLGKKKHTALYNRLKAEVCQPNTQESSLNDIAVAVLAALQRCRFLPKHLDRKSIKISMRSDGSYRLFLDDVEPKQSKYFTIAFKEVMAPISNQPYLIPKYEFFTGSIDGAGEPEAEDWQKFSAKEERFFRSYLRGNAEPRIACYHAVPSLLARSEKGRKAFESAWNKYVSPGFIVETETKPELIDKYFGMGPSLAQRLLWE